ncbi:SET domain-containing protein [Hypoxylon sp. NC0597]|nr:SET domain-containing protein [Hypoxylon sp. NC0597]
MGSQTFYRSIELRHVEGMGVGMIATEFIPKGTIIISEPALIIIPSRKNTIETFCEMYTNLSDESREQYDRLYANPKTIRQYSDWDQRSYFERWYDDHMKGSGVNFKTVAGQQKRTNDVKRLIIAYAVYMTNGAGVEWAKGGSGTGVFATYCRINHSCAPNCSWTFRGSNPVLMKVKTSRGIAAGEQIFICYHWKLLDPVQNLNRAARRQILRDWGFLCECTRCSNELRETLAAMPNSPFADDRIVKRSSLGNQYRSQIVDNEEDEGTIGSRATELDEHRNRGGRGPYGSIV